MCTLDGPISSTESRGGVLVDSYLHHTHVPYIPTNDTKMRHENGLQTRVAGTSPIAFGLTITCLSLVVSVSVCDIPNAFAIQTVHL